MITPIIETARLLLRPLKVADATLIYNNWASDPEVAKYMNWSLHQSIDDTIEWLSAEEKDIAAETNYTWGFVLKENQELFGSGGIRYNAEYEMYELGYNIMKKYWNLGLTTEAAWAMIDFATQELGISSFLGRHATENPASGRIMEKLGFSFQREGQYTSFDGARLFNSREYLLSVKSTK
ncbi:MAG: GNAT family N-acetyltransferase [Dehalococcoidia bacterium]|nr:GNAT family N-acetyltransferase [Dehalococcoidia bacterium]